MKKKPRLKSKKRIRVESRKASLVATMKALRDEKATIKLLRDIAVNG